MKKITEQEYSEYEKILKKYQRMRRSIIKAHKSIAERNKSFSRLPQLVAPEREKKIRLSQFRLTGRRVFNFKMRQLRKALNSGYEGFYKQYKQQYLELYQTLISENPEGLNFAQKQALSQGKNVEPYFYTDMQIKEASPEEAEFMKDYNAMVSMNPYVFAVLLKTGKIPEFKYLYNQFKDDVRTQENWLAQMITAIRMARTFNVKEAKAFLQTGIYSHLSKANKALFGKVK